MDILQFRKRLNSLGYAYIILQPPAQGSLVRTAFSTDFEISQKTGPLLVIEVRKGTLVSRPVSEILEISTKEALSWIRSL